MTAARALLYERKIGIMSGIYLRRRLGIQEHFVGYLFHYRMHKSNHRRTENLRHAYNDVGVEVCSHDGKVIYYDDNMLERQHESK
jgi:hypothetical protein